MTDLELAWLAGLLEGEGSFLIHKSKRRAKGVARVSLAMTDEDVVRRAAQIMSTTVGRKNPTAGYQQQYRAEIEGGRAIALIRRLQPLMGERRAARIQEILDAVDRGEVSPGRT